VCHVFECSIDMTDSRYYRTYPVRIPFPHSLSSEADTDTSEQLRAMARILMEVRDDLKRVSSEIAAVRVELREVNIALGKDRDRDGRKGGKEGVDQSDLKHCCDVATSMPYNNTLHVPSVTSLSSLPSFLLISLPSILLGTSLNFEHFVP
jgi:hypothetical protein